MRFLLVALLASLPALSSAQEPNETLVPGEKIRIPRRPGTHEVNKVGTLVSTSLTGAVIRFKLRPESTTTFPLSRLEVVRGRRTHAVEGAAIGTLAGLVVGFAHGHASGSDCTGSTTFVCIDRNTSGGIEGVLGAAIGMAAGGIIGRLSKTDRWIRVVPTRKRRSQGAPAFAGGSR